MRSRLYNFFSRSYFLKNTKYIFVYFDSGVSPYSAFGSLNSFKKLLEGTSVQVDFINSEQIKSSDWENHAEALIIPGGRSLPYYQSLSHKGNTRISDYVKNGGRYLGICAGAYYASHKTIFESGTNKELLLEGPLNLFPGMAIGPAYGSGMFQYYTLRGAKAALIRWPNVLQNYSNEGKVYYNGGCYFSNFLSSHFKPLANYGDILNSPCAVIEGNVGNGKVILSGVHFEIDSNILTYNPFSMGSDLKKILANNEKFRLLSLQNILKRFSIPMNSKPSLEEKCIRLQR